ncbi:peptidase M20 [Lysinibacillus sp. FJAT-14745]|uniref:amidohydrolase n=1 Tax=Lysinibacillus sp. FJAT-14745 TaxID=1704289 RepID=UPI0006ABBB7D|nr:amidohydrolase [Lysinibacillus sp. FJAT-14745]KOP69909.1 peptidase M20 [Lysinibacillus sp. FJAT-14745]
MNQHLLEKIDAHYDEMVAIRRHLHMHPELSFQEQETANYIIQFYKNLGVPLEANVSGYGLIARIKGSKPGKTIALRADFDALPIQDEKDVPYKSTVSGVMHACGHDGHTATLLIIGKLLWEMRDELAGQYVLIHQHAEEVDPGGAIGMVQAGALNGVDAIFGTHLSSNHPTGMIGYRVGPMMAAVDSFEIKIQGQGGHGAHPHQTKDAIVIGSQLVMNLQQLVARRVDPIESAVLSVGSFVASNADNIIADTAYLNGTIRTFDKDVRETMEREFKRVIQGTEIAHDCTIELDYRRGYPAVVNHEKETLFVRTIAQDICDVAEVEATMGAEDFSYYLEEKPGTFFFTGAEPTEYAPHHHPKFDIDEKGMLIAAKVLLTAALDYQFVE